MKPSIFDFNGSAVRVIPNALGIWFVASDVCLILDLGNPRSSLALLDEDEKGVHTMDTPGGEQSVTVLSEAGVYSLIFKSRKPEAKAFRRWVTHEVLPSIRQTGSYSVSPITNRIDVLLNELRTLRNGEIAPELLKLLRPRGEFGEVASNGNPKMGFRAASWVASAKCRLEEAAEINKGLRQLDQLELALGCFGEEDHLS